MTIHRPHVLGIDDAPFEKSQERDVPIVGVMTEGAAVVESVAITSFPVDGAGVTSHLADWIAGLRVHPALQAVFLGGITMAGLSIVDVGELSRRLARPVMAITRSDTATNRVREALEAAALADRIPTLERSPPARRVGEGLFVATAGLDDAGAATIVRATLGKARIPEPLRIAHLIGRALVLGESRGRA